FAAGSIIRMLYGHEAHSKESWHYQVAHSENEVPPEAGIPGGTPIDIFPFLRHFPSWFPGTFYANLVRSNRHLVHTLHEAPVAKIQAQMAPGSAESSFVLTQLETMNREGSGSRITLDDIQGGIRLLHWVCLGGREF
ncbi:hypothetical protein DXG01_015235, partial [Tephrocybe rancida]